MKTLFTTAYCGALLMFAGCASLMKHADSAELLVQYATVKIIVNASDEADRLDRANRIAEIARDSRKLFDGRSLPLAEIELAVRDRIDWLSLDAADVLLINTLINRVVSEVEDSASLPDSDLYITGSQVLGWIESAALMSGAQ